MRSPRGHTLHLRIVLGEGAALGPGKADLLQAIGETGSIRAAGSRFRMSYRRAWGLVADLNAIFDEPLVETDIGGKGGGGARLTPLGHDVLALYRAIESKAAQATENEVAALSRRTRTPPEG